MCTKVSSQITYLLTCLLYNWASVNLDICVWVSAPLEVKTSLLLTKNTFSIRIAYSCQTFDDGGTQGAPPRLGSVVKSLKKRFKLDFVYCWHGLPGYWSGVATPEEAPNMAKYNSKLVYAQPTPGLYEIEPSSGLQPFCGQWRWALWRIPTLCTETCTPILLKKVPTTNNNVLHAPKLITDSSDNLMPGH